MMIYRITHAAAFIALYFAIMGLCAVNGWVSYSAGATSAMLAFTLADIVAAAVREWRNSRAARPMRAQDVCMPPERERRQAESSGWWYFVIIVGLSGWLSVELLRAGVPALIDALASVTYWK